MEMKVLRQIKEHIKTQGCNKHGTKKDVLQLKLKLRFQFTRYCTLRNRKKEKLNLKIAGGRRQKLEQSETGTRGEDVKLLREKLD